MRPTLYEFAGGQQAFETFAAALHARCLADRELNHPFSHPDDSDIPADLAIPHWSWDGLQR